MKNSPMYQQLQSAVAELEQVMQQLEPVLKKVNEKPNALVFGDDGRTRPYPYPRRQIMKKWILVLTLLLTGCSSSESTQTKTYVLPSTEPKTELVFDSVTIIMPSYLQGPGIVYRLSETEIRVANKKRLGG